jgi:hypothetical protein
VIRLEQVDGGGDPYGECGADCEYSVFGALLVRGKLAS